MEVAEVFYQGLTQKMPLADFETWVYNTPELESVLGEEDYLAVISLNYSNRWALHELRKALDSHVNWAEVRRQELLEALQTILRRGAANDVLAAFSLIYHWYCQNYFFLQDIAFDFLSADNDFLYDPEGKWARLTENQKQQYISSFYPRAQKRAKQLIQQLESGQIQLHTQGQEDIVTYTEIGVNNIDEKPESLQKGGVPTQKWWQLWK